MENFDCLIKKMNESLRIEDKHMCNYLLIEKFDFGKSDLVKIFNILSLLNSPKKGLELIYAAFYHLDIFCFHFEGYCPTQIAKRLKSDISKQRLFFLMLYKECTDEEISKFFQFVFGEIFLSPTCVGYFTKLSNLNIIFDDNFKGKVKDFADKYQLKQLLSYLKELNSGIQYDGKRRRENNENILGAVSNITIQEHYKINDDRKNLCLVYNNYSRTGSEFDVDSLSKTFSNIKGFTVKQHVINTKEELMDSLLSYAKSNSPNSDMIVCCISTHGENGHFIDKYKVRIPEEDIINIFSPSNAPTLGGKPKIFFFQVCRGDQDNKFVKIQATKPNCINVETDCPLTLSSIKAVEIGEYFICHSTVPGCKSVRFTDKGSWFIQRLCDLITDYKAR